jgi:hypothetical protein
MKRLSMLLSVWMLFAGCETSKKTIFLDKPSTMLPTNLTIDLASYLSRYGDKDGVYLSVSESFEHSGESSESMNTFVWKFHHVRQIAYVVINPDAQNLTTFGVRVRSNQALKDVFLKHTSPSGQVHAYSLAHLRQEKNSDGSVTYKFVYPSIEKGSLIEEGYEIEYRDLLRYPPLSHEVALQYDYPIEKIKFRYAYPNWWNINVKRLRGDYTLPVREERDVANKKIVLVYEAKDVQPYASEPFAPFRKEVVDYVELMITHLRMGGLFYTATSSWDMIARQLESYASIKSDYLKRIPQSIKTQAAVLTRTCSTDLQKLDTVTTYLQQNVVVSSEAKDNKLQTVLQKRIGHPVAITGLAQALLIASGVQADYLLIHDAADGYFDRGYVSGTQLSASAIGVVLDGRQYLAFPWIKDLPITHIPENFQGQYALRISPTGSIDLVEVSAGSLIDNESREKYSLIVQDDGTIEVTEEKAFSGSVAYRLRKKLEHLKTDEMEHYVRELLTYTEGEVKLREYQWHHVRDFKVPLELKLRYTIDNLVTVAGSEVILQTGGLLSPSALARVKIESQTRQNPVRIYYNESYRKDIDIRFPAGWKLRTPLTDIKKSNLFGSVAGTYHVDDGHLSARQHIVLSPSLAGPEQYGDLLEIVGVRSLLSVPTLVFENSP